MTTESGPAGCGIPRDLVHRKRGDTVDTRIQQPHRVDHDRQDECLHACNDGRLAPLGRGSYGAQALIMPWPRFSYPTSSVAALLLPYF
jgi:hypothetical protein